MTTSDRETLEALVAQAKRRTGTPYPTMTMLDEALPALERLLGQPEQEPVASMTNDQIMRPRAFICPIAGQTGTGRANGG